MAKHFGLSFSLVGLCVLLASPTVVKALSIPEPPPEPQDEPTSPPETPYTDGTPFPPETPDTPEPTVIWGDPPFTSQETPPTPVTPPATEIPCEEDTNEPSPYPEGGCESPPPYDGPCAWCQCADGEWMCAISDCAPPACVDGYTAPGECCETCPNGPNCEADGQIIPVGQTVQLDSGVECTCQSEMGYWGPPQALCTPKRPSCDESAGPGMDMACGYCWCDEDTGGWVCLDRPCYPPLCVDVVKSEDGCCDECPNGYNCEAFGEIIPWGEMKTLANGMVCSCEFDWSWGSSPLQAQCFLVPEPPTEYIPDYTPESTPEYTPESTPDYTPESTPDYTPESTPDYTPESTPDYTPESTPENATGSTPENATGSTPEITPESTTESAPEETPVAKR